MSTIQIMIACHKPSMLPDNPLYLPVQVGAALKSERLAGMQPDDEGENISRKNPQYCELTAQYWGWKNLQADYVGLCHYRRLFYFGDQTFKLDLRNQIVGEVMTPYTLQKYGLNDEAAMRRIIEDADVIVGNDENVAVLATPYGPQPTAMRHWAAHNRALIMTDHLNEMLSILKEKYPEKYPAAMRRLNSKTFVGYNCFVMKREIFEEMCEFEFSILEELEQRVDLRHCHTQICRIYGFMAEILFNIFVDELQHRLGLRIRQVPLIYFNDTEKPQNLTARNDSEPIAFILDTPHGYLFMPALVSFLKHMNPMRRYDITLLHENIRKGYIDKIRALCASYPNVTLRFVNTEVEILGEMKEKTSRLVRYEPFLPWIFSGDDHLTVFSWYLLFQPGFDALFDLPQSKPVLACRDVLSQGKINDIYPDYDQFVVEELKLKNKYDYFDASVMKLDLAALRAMNPKAVYDQICSTDVRLSRWDALNMVWQSQVEFMDLKFNVQLPSNDYKLYAMPFAPMTLYQAWQRAQKEGCILQFAPDDPWYPIGSVLDDLYWQYARESGVYETLLAHMIARRSEPPVKPGRLRRTAEAMFPKNSRQRAWITRIFPKKSRRRAMLKKMIGLHDL